MDYELITGGILNSQCIYLSVEFGYSETHTSSGRENVYGLIDTFFREKYFHFGVNGESHYAFFIRAYTLWGLGGIFHTHCPAGAPGCLLSGNMDRFRQSIIGRYIQRGVS